MNLEILANGSLKVTCEAKTPKEMVKELQEAVQFVDGNLKIVQKAKPKRKKKAVVKKDAPKATGTSKAKPAAKPPAQPATTGYQPSPLD